MSRTATPWMGSFKFGDETERRTRRLDESDFNDTSWSSEPSQRLGPTEWSEIRIKGLSADHAVRTAFNELRGDVSR